MVSQWPTFIAYVVSFSLIYLGWLNYNLAFEKLKTVGIKEFLWNGVWMFIVTIIPFTTRWVSEHPDCSLPEFLYYLVMFVWALVTEVQIINHFAKQDNQIKHMQWLRYVLIVGYLLAMLVAFLKPICSIFIVALMVIIWIIGLLKMKHE